MRMLRSTITLAHSLALLVIAGFITPNTVIRAAQLNGEKVSIHHVESSNCKECHKKIYGQWKGSMHANSTALKDPIHGAFYQQVIGDPLKEGLRKNGKYPVCLQCHAPNAAKDGKTKLDSKAAYSEGINCVACHTLKKFKGIKSPSSKMQLGISAYETSTILQGANAFLHEQGEAGDKVRAAIEESGDLNPHLGKDNQGNSYLSTEDSKALDLPMEKNTLFQTSNVCMGCHERRNNFLGVPLCATGDEFIADKSNETCQSCHMPVNDGVMDHSMEGGHSVAMLRRSIRLDISSVSKGDKLAVEVTLKNNQPHNVPTAAPFRNMYIKVTALAKDGSVVWRNFEKHPMKEDPKSYFYYHLADDEGNLATPPKATQVVADSRLRAYEKRNIVYEMPLKGLYSVRAELYYNLLWPGLVKKLNHLPDKLKSAKRIAWGETVIGCIQ
ncbi:MAG: hypothetical protein DRQ49_00015 [Gammaproteobacteria bacterium]|nr:MAG: hypothetical protein DRQ49_00015 [Gammaproteobacteria bacterium]